jgi:hypothetical protein
MEFNIITTIRIWHVPRLNKMRWSHSLCRRVGYPVCALFPAQLPHLFPPLFTLLTSPFLRGSSAVSLMMGCCVSALVLTRRFGLGIPFCTFGLENIRYRGKLCNIHLRFWFVSLLLRK